VLVSHDRDFLDNVVTSTLVFEAIAGSANTSAVMLTGRAKKKNGPSPKH